MNNRENKNQRRGNSPRAAGPGRRPPVRKKPRRGRMVILVLVLLLLIAAVVFILWGVFGKVEVGSDDISRTPDITTSATGGNTSAPTSGDASGTTTAAVTTTTAVPLSPETAKNYRQPSGAAWNLVLVNDFNAVPAGYEQNTTMEWVSGGQMDQRAAESYRQMLADGAAYDIRGVSLFRPQSLQESLFSREVAKWKGQGYGQEEAEQKANTVVKRPGYSEHNTGLAADVGGSGNYSLNQDFENTDAYRWLIEHCADYGFILRFPKDKEEITGVIFEPWHYRYVGKEAAQEIMSRGLCLEEYLCEKGL